MKCPHCGGEAEMARVCPYCGRELRVFHPEDIPLGKYKGLHSYVQLCETGLIVCNRFLKPTREIFVPYDRLTGILYERDRWMAAAGTLRLRTDGTPPEEISNVGRDETTVFFTISDNGTFFYQLFYLLLALAPEDARSSMLLPAVDIPTIQGLMNQVDMEEYFRLYNPCREIAVEAVMEECAMKRKPARNLVDYYFDMRQKEIYAQDPQMILRDLKWAIAKKYAKKQQDGGT